MLPIVAVSVKTKDQEVIETKTLSSVTEWKTLMQIKVRDSERNAAAYQYVDDHNKSLCLAAIKTISTSKHKFGMGIAEWKSTHKIRCFYLEKWYLLVKIKVN